MTHPILVTGAASRVGGVVGLVVEALRPRGLPAMLGGNLVMQILSCSALPSLSLGRWR